MADINERVAALESGQANIFHQLDEIKTDVRDIRRLTVTVEKIAVRVEDTALKVDGIDARLDAVEKTPGENFKHYKRVVISAVLTGICGIIIGAIMALIIK